MVNELTRYLRDEIEQSKRRQRDLRFAIRGLELEVKYEQGNRDSLASTLRFMESATERGD